MRLRRRLPLLFLLAALTVYAGFWLARWKSARMIDFTSFYAASVAARAGGDLYDVEALNQAAASKGIKSYAFPYLYPPVLAHLAMPWGSLTPRNAIFSLVIFSLALLFPALLLTARDARERVARWGGEAPDAAFVFAAVTLVALPFHDNLDMGQVNILILCLIVLCLHFAQTGREALGGVFLGFAALFKVTPLFLLFYLLARGRYKAVAACAVTMIGVAAMTLPMGAWPQWERFFAALPTMSYGRTIPGLFSPAFHPNFSLAGLFSRLFPDDIPRIRTATIALIAIFLAAAVWLLRKRRDSPGAEIMVLPFLVLMAVSSPLTYLHHVVYVAPGLVLALAYAWNALRGWRRPATVLALLLAMLVAAAPWPSKYGGWHLSAAGEKFLTSLNLYGLLALALLGAALALRPAPGPAQNARAAVPGP